MEQKLLEYLEIIIDGIYDCLEECFETFTVAKGRKAIYVIYAILAMLVLSVLLLVLKLPAFINWYEALLAAIIMSAVLVSNNWNSKVITDLRNKLRKGDK